jgi:hypothetical protein
MCGRYECKLCQSKYSFCGGDASLSRAEVKVCESYCGYCRKYLEKRKIKFASVIEPLPYELKKSMIEYSFRKQRHHSLGKLEREQKKLRKDDRKDDDDDDDLARNLAQTTVFPPTLPLGEPQQDG